MRVCAGVGFETVVGIRCTLLKVNDAIDHEKDVVLGARPIATPFEGDHGRAVLAAPAIAAVAGSHSRTSVIT
ncbi:MAG: hypothetical protein AB7F22_09155 [Reyranella sp.]|uniref:hypothetical protein n=1 Tax=Reyranella sp. TaxID=1929291 RepID=UPI003D0A33F1